MNSDFDSIRQRVLDLGYKFFDNGDYNLNHIWVRTSEEITNKFDDVYYCLYYINNEPQILSIPCTTKPGKNNIITYMLLPGQYSQAWRFSNGISLSRYPFTFPHFRQIKNLKCWKVFPGGNIDKSNIIIDNQNHTHWHAMSNPGRSGYNVNNWSEECMGAESPFFNKIIELTNKALPIYGSVFTGTIIEKF